MARNKRIPHCRLMLVENIKPGMMVSSARYGRDRYVNLDAVNLFHEVISAYPSRNEGKEVLSLCVWAGGGRSPVRRHKRGTRLLVRVRTQVFKRKAR